MASTMRWLSASEIMASPAARGATATEGAAATGEAAGGAAPGRPGRAPRARHRQDDRSARAPSPPRPGLRLPAALSCDAAHDDEEGHHEEQKCQQVGQARLIVRAALGARLPFLGIDRHGLDDVIHPASDSAGEIVHPKTREDGILYDEPRDRVGERAFETIADLDAHLALVRRHDQQGAGVLVLLSDLPVPPELIAVVLDRGVLQRLEGDHDKLARGLGLELGELALER